jgi:hypothetical protein
LPFKCNLQRFTEEEGALGAPLPPYRVRVTAAEVAAGVGLCTLNQVDP